MLRHNTKKFIKTSIALFILVSLTVNFSFSRSDLTKFFQFS
ncbi:hypothetical protein BVAVS116_H0024 (plasmid) [Borreliella valaisiana VS116]|uniref:Uncharacterized protein n=1 Tax=Borreliella valaisiana VS116 TaxID=445987 RepID=C0R981_BORVA|nr:hypothetical protein BVAVS116_H0024 [Borreliella valaisiana VS116]